MTRFAALVIALLVLAGCGSNTPEPGRAARASRPAPAELAIGQPLPDVLLPELGRPRQSLRDLAQGKVLLVDVWAAWCGPCKVAAPHLQAMYNRFRDRGFLTVGVMVDDNATSIAPEVLAEAKPVYPQFIDEGQKVIGEAWGLTASLPLFVLVDRDGKVLRVDTGLGEFKALQAAVEAAVRGQSAPAEGVSG